MNRYVNPCLLPLILAPLLTACVGTTGSGIVDFDAYASGPSDTSGAPGATHAYTFLSPYSGYTITLSQAMLQIGAVYLDAAPCNGSSGIPPCVNQEAATVAQVTGVPTTVDYNPTSGLFLDTLSPDQQVFKGGGTGLIQDAESAEVWLMSNPMGEQDAIDDLSEAPTIAEVAGTAVKDGEMYTFTATVTIGQNRLITAANPALPGENPICDERIVRPICLTPPIEPEPGTSFHVEVDPKGWFDNVDFSRLGAAGGTYPIPDNNNDATGRTFFQGLESSSGVYSFTFQTP